MVKQSRRSFFKTVGRSTLAGGTLVTGGLTSIGAEAAQKATTQTAQSQAAMTPARALQLLKAGNARFVERRMLDHDLEYERQATAAGQFPLAAIVGCIDSRASNELIFDQSIGDIFSTRVAGNYIDDGVLGGLEFACVLSGAKLILVVGHNDCGAVKGACDNVMLGNLTSTLANIQPAVGAVKGFEPDRSSDNPDFVQAVAKENVMLSLERIRTNSPLLRELEQDGTIGLQGGMYDLTSGRVTFL
ncbi:MAG: carbonic anhydrase family protein [Alphaproteobacteria bacterium]|nr:carbonic anhydrase family protein [Alphaproteobacteria bacterium]